VQSWSMDLDSFNCGIVGAMDRCTWRSGRSAWTPHLPQVSLCSLPFIIDGLVRLYSKSGCLLFGEQDRAARLRSCATLSTKPSAFRPRPRIHITSPDTVIRYHTCSLAQRLACGLLRGEQAGNCARKSLRRWERVNRRCAGEFGLVDRLETETVPAIGYMQ
jgi:hypothetical protein